MTKILDKYVVIDRHDIEKSIEDLLRDLLFESTGSRIPGDKIKYGKPQELDQRPHDKYDPNTFIPVLVDIVYDTRYRTIGDGFMYRRRSIIEHMAGVDFTEVKPEFFPFRISDIIDQINERLEYPISMDDIEEYEYTTASQWLAGVRIQARADSYLWTDGESVMIDTTAISHENLFTKHVLDGFNIFQPAGGPYVIPGFYEHRGPCTNPECPICSPTGRVTSNTPAHISNYVALTERDVNTAFRTTPANVEPEIIDKPLELDSHPVPEEIIDEPPLYERVPQAQEDDVTNPYTDDNLEEMDLSKYNPAPIPEGATIPGARPSSAGLGGTGGDCGCGG